MALFSDSFNIPPHLRKYVVTQDYAIYNHEDQAVWRYLMRQLKNYLSENAHSSYVEGLEKTGIPVDYIPNIYEMNRRLRKFGWGAIPVSGFIPPAAFMEFQARGYLPIASDMRTLEHTLYTPAPDIVHEAAGHAPILADESYASYLKHYAEVAANAIISKQDLEQYQLIRELSDLKESPSTSEEKIKQVEQKLIEVTESIKEPSEAGVLSRINWWTAEYGLVGDPSDPKIFGAGLLSSLGEAKACLDKKVKKIPLSINCIEYGYDITEMQPQLFVTPDFEALKNVLDELADKMSFRKGGCFGLDQVKKAATINSVQLNSGVQISGKLDEYIPDPKNPEQAVFIKFSGPSQISYDRIELIGHDKKYHQHGYSTPIGLLEGQSKCLSTFREVELAALGIERKARVSLTFASQVNVEGIVSDFLHVDGRLIIISFTDCTVTHGERVLFEPSWGTFDMAVGTSVTSVFGGPADKIAYGDIENFSASRIPEKSYSPEQLLNHKFLGKIRHYRENKENFSAQDVEGLIDEYLSSYTSHWLIGVEVLELCHLFDLNSQEISQIRDELNRLKKTDEQTKQCIIDGISLADKVL